MKFRTPNTKCQTAGILVGVLVALVQINTASAAVVCDYRSANVNNDWGWNATTRESCSPIAIDQGSSVQGPDLVATFAQPFSSTFPEEFPRFLQITRDGTIYFFGQLTNAITAIDVNGNFVWETKLPNTLLVVDMQLNAAENRLIVNYVGGEVGSLFLDGQQEWLVENPGTQANKMKLGNTAIIVRLNNAPSSRSLTQRIVSIGYDGQERWGFSTDGFVNSVTIGQDDNIYVRVSSEQEELYVFKQ